MKFYRSGEKSRAICASCKKLVGTTFAYRDVPFDDGEGEVKDILAAICDECGAVVSIPAQSTPAIRRARDTANISLEVMLPAPDLEVLDAAAFRIDPRATTKFRKILITYYAHRMAQSGDAAVRLRTLSLGRKDITCDTPRKRLSFKMTPRMDAEVQALMERSGLNRTDLMRGLVGEIEQAVVKPDEPEELLALRDLAAVVA
jgi:hypothetical protein